MPFSHPICFIKKIPSQILTETCHKYSAVAADIAGVIIAAADGAKVAAVLEAEAALTTKEKLLSRTNPNSAPYVTWMTTSTVVLNAPFSTVP